MVSGFLGSGKTTLIRQLAGYLVVDREQKVVIIENEVGEVGIDDRFLSGEGFQVREIYGGCICCQLTGELTLAVNQIAERFSPDWVIIEATGVARPSTILNTLERYGKGIDGIFTLAVADTGRWEELMEIMPELISAQVAEAKLVIASKIDEAGEGELQRLMEKVKEINPRAGVVAASLIEGLDEPALRRLLQDASA
ncbi:CobW-like protein [Thermacetogenium phaeum DSM 12270]|uniref:CobW-like protein n=1 Tax=Thermacetogenium phaeum (strain ATCC BAA-254 / DSM 26808 / PB) TaxID=1089553 RepID=K4LIY6_THEPS|nr:CobW-like protein [Thermacetogenium phaeum DSM 12270]